MPVAEEAKKTEIASGWGEVASAPTAPPAVEEAKKTEIASDWSNAVSDASAAPTAPAAQPVVVEANKVNDWDSAEPNNAAAVTTDTNNSSKEYSKLRIKIEPGEASKEQQEVQANVESPGW